MKRDLILITAAVALVGALSACSDTAGGTPVATVDPAFEPGTTQQWVRYTQAGETH